jgi:hypothetical protein
MILFSTLFYFNLESCMSECHKCHLSCTLRDSILTCSYRDIYYRDPELFMKQAVVDRYVGDLAYTLGVERDALNVASLHIPLDCCQFLINIRLLQPRAWLPDHSPSRERMIQWLITAQNLREFCFRIPKKSNRSNFMMLAGFS